jgi:hypothetical protein
VSFDDEPVKFYLRHRVQIEQWAALRNDAAKAMDDWLERLGPRVQAVAPHAVLRTAIKDTDYPSFRLVDPSWGFDDARDPPASICLEWVRGRTWLVKGQTPYVGLRTPKDGPLTATLRARAEDARKQPGDLQSPWWAAYRHVAPPPQFPDDADAYADVLAAQLADVWQRYAGLVPGAPTAAPPAE